MKELSEHQERFLSAYKDSELGFFGTAYVEKILLKKAAAREFLLQVSDLSNSIQTELANLDSSKERNPNWNVLNSRLLQIDKNSVFHDASFPFSEEAISKTSFWKRHPLSATLATATTAFCLGLVLKLGFLNYLGVDQTVNSPQNIVTATNNSELYMKPNAPVTLASANNFSKPSSVGSSVELDWVKSDGRIRLIPAKDGSTNIIWVKAPRNVYLENLPNQPRR
jgi:hypothetical protein